MRATPTAARPPDDPDARAPPRGSVTARADWMRRGWARCCLVWAILGAWIAPGLARAAADPQPVRVYAAASLTDVLTEVSRRFEASTGHAAPVLAYSASSTLVRQVERGAPADLVITADAAWMDHLAGRNLLMPQTRVDLVGNRLAIVVPGEHPLWASAAQLGASSIGTIAVAAEGVPAGKRAHEAVSPLDAAVPQKFVAARNVRAALALAAHDQVDAAIVYRTDAWASERVSIVWEFPAATHAPIVYPAALTVRGAGSAAARRFLAFLLGPQAREVFAEAGFEAPVPPLGPPPPRSPPATWRTHVPSAHDATAPVRLSLWVAAVSLVVSLGPAVALGWLLARRDFVGKSLVSTLLLAPLVLPPVVVGFVLLEIFGRGGALAPLLAWLGLEVAFTQLGAIVAAAVVGFPLLVLMSRLAIEAVDVRFEQIAQTLGRSPFGAFVRVTLPMALPGLAAGCVLAYARALGEFGATAVLASDVPGHTRTLALAIFALYEQPGLETQAHRLVWISIGLCSVALMGYEWLGRIQKRRLAA